MMMKKNACPECNTPAYDDTSFFCYKCGAQLSADIPEKRPDLNFRMKNSKNTSKISRDDPPISRWPRQNNLIKPIEICSRCGNPVIDKTMIFCPKCTAYVRDVPKGEEMSVIKYPVPESLLKKPVITDEIYHHPEYTAIKKQEPMPQGTGNPINPKASGWKLMRILAALAILLSMLILMVVLMFTFWVSLY